jgi:translation initiation factor RLI1
MFCRFVIVVEHDLSVLDYLSDFICCLYGVPGAYGVVTMPFSVREGNCEEILSLINTFKSMRSYVIFIFPKQV